MIERFRALDSFSKSALFVVAVLWVSTHIGALAMWLAAGDANMLMAWVILDVSFAVVAGLFAVGRRLFK